MPKDLTPNQTQFRIPFYNCYLSKPPVIGPILASMVVNGIAFEPLHVQYSKSDYCQDVAQRIIDRNGLSPVPGTMHHDNVCTSISFNSEWWGEVLANPITGFLITYGIAWAFFSASEYVSRASDSYKDSWAANKIADSMKLSYAIAESVLPSRDTLYDTLKFVALSGATSAIYGVIGAGCLGKISEVKDATDIATTQAIGGAALPTIGVGILWGYRAAKSCLAVVQSERQESDVPLLPASGSRMPALLV